MDPVRAEYDQIKDHIQQMVVEVTAHYAGPKARTEGSRVVFWCPGCNKDSLTAHPKYVKGPITGCWNHDCPVPNSVNPVYLIAYMEGLDPKDQYRMILDRGNDIIAGPMHTARDRVQKKRAAKKKASISVDGLKAATSGTSGTSGTAETAASAPHFSANGAHQQALGGELEEDLEDSTEDLKEDAALTDSVYRKLLGSCGLPPEAWSGLIDRGLTKQTILGAGIGYISAYKAKTVMKSLYEEFGDGLARVPGFYRAKHSATGFWSNFAGKDLILFPYHDSKGRIRTIEGRVMFGKEDTEKYKYLSLTGSGSHLYVYPGMGFENIEAFCEGLIGAILAAQEGICVASIQGYRRYRASGGEHPLSELSGIDFRKKRIAFIPDIDHPPKTEVAAEAPEAARWLIAKQGGAPVIAIIPSGKDLDEYLLEFKSHQRRRVFDQLLAHRSCSLEHYENVLEQGAAISDAAPGQPRPEQGTPEQGTPGHAGQAGQQATGATGGAGYHQGQAATDEPGDSDDRQRVDGIATGTGHNGSAESGSDAAPEEGGAEQDEGDHRQVEPEEATEELTSAAAQAIQQSTNQETTRNTSQETVPGDQFYRQDVRLPEHPSETPEPSERPDPRVALGLHPNRHPGYGATVQAEDTSSKEPWTKRLREFLQQGTISVAKAASKAAVKFFLIFLGVYVSLLVLMALAPSVSPIDGMWKWIAAGTMVCLILRSRLRRQTRILEKGKTNPGARTA